ncbi:MAG: alpha/beta hydrolase [Rhizobiales bacterium]|nr:alpha/beta hydrolase [Hyphomicrobiales bacterium]
MRVASVGRHVVGDIDTIRELLASKPRPTSWAERRDRINEVGSTWPVADDITCTPAEFGSVQGEWTSAPHVDPSRVLLFFHGGGFCSGSVISHRRLASEAGRAAGARCLAIDYRLAPEHPFPAALEDALRAWLALRRSGIEARHIAVAGDSAGGGLSVALANELREAGEDSPGCLWLISPWTDLTLSGPTLASKDAEDPLIHKPYLEQLASAYVAGRIERRDPRVSVLFADLKNLPPMLIQVGSEETLLSDATRFAEATGAANVSITLEIWPHMIHAWPVWNGGLAEGRDAIARAGTFLRKHLANEVAKISATA